VRFVFISGVSGPARVSAGVGLHGLSTAWLNKECMKKLFQVAPWLMSIGALTWPLRADELVVDQRNEFDGAGLVPFYTVVPVMPVGQEFTPATNSLSFVDLVTCGGGASSATLQVLIRPGSLANPVWAASELVLATNSMTVNTNRFLFTPAAQLVPGNTYVLQIVTKGTDLWSVGASSDTYPRGRFIHNGLPDTNVDLWFREGYVVPAPESPLLSIRISHVTVSWSSSLGKTYQVQYRSELTTNIWTDLGAPVAGNGLTNSVVDAIAGPQRFYRVITSP
jgi:hypothetical protein